MHTETSQNLLTVTRKCVHPECIVCSRVNSRGLHLNYDIDDDGNIKAIFQCEKFFEGYPGIVHGGVISSILDGAMGNYMFAHGQTAVTVEMITKFRHPVLTGRKAMVSARITRASHPIYLLEAEIIQDGKVKAMAKGKYYNQPKRFNSDGAF